MKFSTLCGMTLSLILGMSSCYEQHIISSEEEREQIALDLQQREEALPHGDFFEFTIREDLTTQQMEALSFLYAYMPLADIADHPLDYYLEQVNYSLKAREEMPWGEAVPEREFRHFVLPIRVNNENLDDSRKVFYEELKKRIQHLSMREAALEINHWCHEKVVYTPSDGRTSSPLATIKTAHGRCGEESTFTVAALRAMSIPARQVYTPRWAHTDDNHAWVECWVDGKWWFLGACEPEPALNLAWFNAPASRGMMMHTNVFGHYTGPDEIMRRAPLYTSINVTENYAPITKAEVKVVDEKGQAVEGAKVDFKVYNYGEFYTVSRRETNSEGVTHLTAGKGDMLVWAFKDGRYGFEKLSFGTQDKLDIALDKDSKSKTDLEMDIIPPVETANVPSVSDEKRQENTLRMMQEDSIRNAYIATFPTEKEAREFAERHSLNAEKVVKILKKSRGNYAVIEEFMASLLNDEERDLGMNLLELIAEKDLRDATLNVLHDHLRTPLMGEDNATFRQYVLNPRIRLETLTPYKQFFREQISKEDADTYRHDPMKMVEWVKQNIHMDPMCNIGALPITPEGVWKAKVADQRSRDIFFVAMARGLGIPARIDEVTGKVQLMGGSHPVDIDFEQIEKTIAPTGRLILKYQPIEKLDDPKYYTHFTISKIQKDASLRLLTYPEDGTATYKQMFQRGATLDEGNYILVTGTRLANGGVLSTLKTFTIEEGKTTVVDLDMRVSKDEVRVIGSLNSEARYQPIDGGEECSILSTTGRGYFAVGILGMGQEPTNHALKDLERSKADLEKWGRKILLLFTDSAQARMFRHEDFPNLPENVVFGIDTDGKIRQEMFREMKCRNKNNLPMFTIADTFNRVVFFQEGYTIGLGDQLTKVIHKL